MRGNTRPGLLAILVLGTFGCATAPPPSHYQVEIPLLQARPTDYQAGEGIWYRCYRREDAIAIVTEFKAACLALGGSPEQCQAILPPGDPL